MWNESSASSEVVRIAERLPVAVPCKGLLMAPFPVEVPLLCQTLRTSQSMKLMPVTYCLTYCEPGSHQDSALTTVVLALADQVGALPSSTTP